MFKISKEQIEAVTKFIFSLNCGVKDYSAIVDMFNKLPKADEPVQTPDNKEPVSEETKAE